MCTASSTRISCTCLHSCNSVWNCYLGNSCHLLATRSTFTILTPVGAFQSLNCNDIVFYGIFLLFKNNFSFAFLTSPPAAAAAVPCSVLTTVVSVATCAATYYTEGVGVLRSHLRVRRRTTSSVPSCILSSSRTPTAPLAPSSQPMWVVHTSPSALYYQPSSPASHNYATSDGFISRDATIPCSYGTSALAPPPPTLHVHWQTPMQPPTRLWVLYNHHHQRCYHHYSGQLYATISLLSRTRMCDTSWYHPSTSNSLWLVANLRYRCHISLDSAAGCF
uniref:Uncharacterized protein n=1 Tax=Lygus hesperus TaxID=30085 RepID=A0A146LYM0_LYGHE